MEQSQANQMWGGHFAIGPDEIMAQINASISFDQKLWRQDIAGSIVHCNMLVRQQIISAEEGDKIVYGLSQIYYEIENGKFTFSEQLEDIHMNIEARLAEIIGDVAGKLHTARSRNDQVAVDCKLYVKDSIILIDHLLELLQIALVDRAEEYADYLMPGFTHLQNAQIVTFGHHLLAYVEMFARDRKRFRNALAILDECPLGAAALAGTSFPIDRHYTAKELGFREPTRNSMDSVSDRDFALEFLSHSSIAAIHLSRLAEEMVIWCSAGFGFIKLSDKFTSGSSIMPQKRNPDAAELVRAKTGRIIGSLMTLLTVMKGLTLTYSKDMQEDKEPLFDAVESLSLCLSAMKGMVLDMQANRKKMEDAAGNGFTNATDIADYLVKKLQIPFRKAHHITGKIVKLAEDKGLKLEELSLLEMKEIESNIEQDIFEVLSIKNSCYIRKSYGGTSPENVINSVKYWREALR